MLNEINHVKIMKFYRSIWIYVRKSLFRKDETEHALISLKIVTLEKRRFLDKKKDNLHMKSNPKEAQNKIFLKTDI